MAQLFSPETEGVNLCYMWHGQVVDETCWVDNNAKEKGKDKHIPRQRDDFQGYGYRYKVRIIGRDLPNKEAGTPDDQLYMAMCYLPATAGSGVGGAVQTPQIKQGTYVAGFYRDGIQAREPVITHVYPNHAQTRLFGGDPNEGFIPRSGYKGKNGGKSVAGRNVLLEGGDHCINENISMGQVLSVSDTDKPDDASPPSFVPSTFNCDGPTGALTSVQIVLKRVFYYINKIKSLANSWQGAMSDLQNGINSIIQDGALIVTNLIKNIIDRIRGVLFKQLDDKQKEIVGSIPPNLRPIVNEANEGATTIIDCVINKIIAKLFDFVFKALSKIADQIINPIVCAVENFMGSLLSKILGTIAGALGPVFDSINGVLGSIAGGNIPGIGSITSIINIVNGIIKFLSCEEDRDCSAGTEWSLFYGAESVTQGINISLSSVVENVRSRAGSSGGSGLSCNTGPTLCGPPKISISGGGGRGAKANPIISAAGAIIGVDLVTGGVGYTSPPNVYLEDSCGSGRGAQLIPLLSLPDSAPVGNNGNPRTTSSSINENGVSGSSNLDGRKPFDATTGIGIPIIWGPRYVVSTEFGDPTRFRSYLTISSEQLDNVEYVYATVNGERLQVFAGGTGGYEVTSGGTGGSPLYDNSGNPIVVDGIAQIVVANGTGGTQVTTTDGTPVFAGGTGGVPVIDTTILPSEDPRSGLINTNDNLLDGPDRDVVLSGDFSGNGSYTDGAFSGTGVFTTDDKKYSLNGQFSGFDASLSGGGTGSFTGRGIFRLGRFEGDGTFTSDSSQKEFKDPEETKDSDDNIFGVLPDGTVYFAKSDGTGTITRPGNNPISVLYAKCGSVGGTQVLSGQTVVTDCKGNPVTVGGDGGTLVRIVGSISSSNCPLTADGVSVTSNGLPVVCESSTGIPVVIGVPSKDPNTTSLSSGNNSLTSDGNTLKAITQIVSSKDLSGEGSFAGPDGGPISDIIVLNSGVGYLPSPNGTTGGSGTVFSNPDNTIKYNINTGYSLYPPNSTIPVLTNDFIYMPPGTEANVYNNNGDLIQSLRGEGQTTPLKITGDGTITTPIYDVENNTGDFPSSDGSYPVVLQLKDVLIKNPGGNYNPKDKITISPSNGAVVLPNYDKFGVLVSVNIEDKGIGFTDIPDMFIDSTTGINAVLIPIFEVIRVGDLQENEDIIPEGVKLIEVIDCVGKIA
jgi:hypothetical protein